MTGAWAKLAWLAVLALALSGRAAAQGGLLPPGEEHVKLNLGGMFYRSDTTLRVDGATRGTEFNTEDTFGGDRDRTTLYGEGIWRFAKRHRLGLKLFQISRDREHTTDRDLVISDTTVPAGTDLRSKSDLTFFIADYRYSFMKTEKLELAGSLGVFGGYYRFRFSATTPPTDVRKSVVIPVPVVGASVDYYPGQRWTLSAFLQGLSLNFDNADSRVYVIGASAEYAVLKNLGLGVALLRDSINLEASKSNFSGKIGFVANSALGYVQLRF
jgi:hypothetical protein